MNNELRNELDERYVTRVDHMKDMAKMNENFIGLRKDVSVIKWCLTVICSTVIISLLENLISLIIK